MTHGTHTETIRSTLVDRVDGTVVSEKDLIHVIGGYKATANSEYSSAEAKSHARARLLELESASNHKDSRHVIAGMKAALHNPHVHDDVKAELRSRLVEMGESVE